MKKTAAVFGGLAGITGLIQIVLGVLFWTGHALGLITLHMIIGAVFVLCLLTLSVLGFRAGHPAQAAGGLVWGVIVLAFGMTQAQILPGQYHWVVRVLHLVMGLIAMGVARGLTVRIQGAGPVSGVQPHDRGASIQPVRPGM
jgi:hypothetical protein